MKYGLLRSICYGVFFVCANQTSAQVAAVQITVQVPSISASDKGVYLAGSFNYWHAGDSLYRMNKISDQLYSITIPVFDGRQYEYKYTLGNWDRVEVAINDSDRHNRKFFSSNGKIIGDTVIKWKLVKPAENIVSNPQLQKINAMKDSALAKLQPELNNMLDILKSYVQNLLKEEPSAWVHKRLDKRVEKKLNSAYLQISKLLWNVMGSLSPEQKQMMQKRISQSNDFLNTFFDALKIAIGEKKP